ncbi:MAG: hypothetical protein AAB215_08050 [Planctomycetota bacterium]
MDTQILKPIRLEALGRKDLRLRRAVPALAIRRGPSFRVSLSQPFVSGVGDSLDSALADLRGAISDLYMELRAKGAGRSEVDEEVWSILLQVVEEVP